MKKARRGSGWGGARAGSGPKPRLEKKLNALMAAIDFRDYCRKRATRIIDKYMKIVETSQDPFAVVAAGNAVLNRAYGRPTETVVVEQEDFEQTNNPLPSFEDVRNELRIR